MSFYSEAEIELLSRRDARIEVYDRKPLTYLACPYTHSSFRMKEMRYVQVTKAAAWLMTQFGWNVFSPITHSHPLHAITDMSGAWDFWAKIDTEYIEVSNRLIVFCIPGWRMSVGVTAEIGIAKRLGIPIQYLKFLGPNNYRLDDQA